MLLGKAEGDVGHSLLTASLIYHQPCGVLLQRLAKTQHIAMPEDGKDAVDEPVLDAI